MSVDESATLNDSCGPSQTGLASFLNGAAPLIAELAQRLQPTPICKADRLQRAIAEFRPPLHQARTKGLLINPWTLAGLKHMEVRNSAVLAQLWRYEVGGDASRAFLGRFLAGIKPFSECPLPTVDDLKNHYSVKVEEVPFGSSAERLDILIESARFIIGIEVKIKAREGSGQLKKYSDAIAKRAAASNRSGFVIFLSPFAPAPNLPVGHANWKIVVNAAHECVPHIRKDRTATHHLIAQFASHASTFEGNTR